MKNVSEWRNLKGLLILLFGFHLILPVMAEESIIGYVKTVSGEAYVVTANNKVPAQPGVPLYQGSRLQTGSQGSVGVTLRDETVISCGPDTDFTIDEYQYTPSQSKLMLASNLLKGSLNYISGVIAKLKPDAVSVKTPTGTIGIRGTQFAVKVEQE